MLRELPTLLLLLFTVFIKILTISVDREQLKNRVLVNISHLQPIKTEMYQ